MYYEGVVIYSLFYFYFREVFGVCGGKFRVYFVSVVRVFRDFTWYLRRERLGFLCRGLFYVGLFLNILGFSFFIG